MRKLFISLILIFAVAVLAVPQTTKGTFVAKGQGVVRRAAGGGASSLLTGLVSYWALEEASGNRADSVGTNTLANGGCCNDATNAAGIIGNAASFNSANIEAIQVSDNASLDVSTAFSKSIWLYQTTIGASRTLFSKWDYPNDGSFACQTTNGGADILCFIASTPTDIGSNAGETTTAGMANATWYHVAVVYDGTLSGDSNRLKIFVNGSQKTLAFTGTIPASILNSAAPFVLGYYFNLGNFMNGRLDEGALYSRALTSGEVTRLYNAGAGCQNPFSACP